MCCVAQTLHAFVSSNPAAHSQLLSPPGSYTFSPSLSVLLSILSAPNPPSTSTGTTTTTADAAEEWTQLRVLAFGVLLEIAKGRSKRRDVETVREQLRTDEAQEVLLELVRDADLNKAVEEARAVAGQIVRPAPRGPCSDFSHFELLILDQLTTGFCVIIRIPPPSLLGQPTRPTRPTPASPLSSDARRLSNSHSKSSASGSLPAYPTRLCSPMLERLMAPTMT